MKTLLIGIISVLLVVACSTPEKKDAAPKSNNASTRIDRAESVVPKVEPKSKYGNPDSYVVFGKRYYVMDSSQGYVEEGIASWYGTKFHGRKTSSQETYDMYAMTAAHKSLPLPTYALVTNKENGRSIIVRINDRGPFHGNRIIDLSYAAATKLGIVTKGTGLVEVRAIDPRTRKVASRSSSPNTGKQIDVIDVASLKVIEESSQNSIDKDVEIFVQVGAFRSRENATKLRAQFASLNVGDVSVRGYSLQNKPIYKVLIGPLGDVEEADKTVEKISDLGHEDHHIVFKD
ncbi:MAG: septal ring lytic transglycosylase RlpA family protein [Pseudomonadota bacterium]